MGKPDSADRSIGREAGTYMTDMSRVIREINELPIALDPYYTPCIACRYTGDVHGYDCPVADFEEAYDYDDDSTDMSTRGGDEAAPRCDFCGTKLAIFYLSCCCCDADMCDTCADKHETGEI
jgi:hypothetical protein